MPEYLSTEALTADRISTAELVDHEIPGLGWIQIRPLSRAEMIKAGQFGEGKTLEYERYTLSKAVVNPKVTEADVARWQNGSFPTEINAVAMKINEISGIGEGADKSNVAEAGGES